jgi:hypothetical protein
MPDHLLLKLKPAVALSDLLRHVKANSSKWLNQSEKVFASLAGKMATLHSPLANHR